MLMTLVVVLLAIVFSVQMQTEEKRAQMEELEESYERYSDKVDEMEYELNRPLDRELVMEIARKKLGYYQLGDTVYYYNRGE